MMRVRVDWLSVFIPGLCSVSFWFSSGRNAWNFLNPLHRLGPPAVAWIVLILWCIFSTISTSPWPLDPLDVMVLLFRFDHCHESASIFDPASSLQRPISRLRFGIPSRSSADDASAFRLARSIYFIARPSAIETSSSDTCFSQVV